MKNLKAMGYGFAGVFMRAIYLRLRSHDNQLPRRPAGLRRCLAAMGTGCLCSVVALLAVVIPGAFGSNILLQAIAHFEPPRALEAWGVLIIGLLYFVGGFFALGVISHKMFARRYGRDTSSTERVLLSPGLYAFVVLFLPAFENESGDPSAHNMIFLMVFLLVLAVSFAGVQYSSRRMKRTTMQDGGNTAITG